MPAFFTIGISGFRQRHAVGKLTQLQPDTPTDTARVLPQGVFMAPPFQFSFLYPQLRNEGLLLGPFCPGCPCAWSYYFSGISLPFSVVVCAQSLQKVSVNGVDQGQLKGVRAPDSDYVRPSSLSFTLTHTRLAYSKCQRRKLCLQHWHNAQG